VSDDRGSGRRQHDGPSAGFPRAIPSAGGASRGAEAPLEKELMVIAAAREIRDGDAVFVGMRLPLLAFALAKRTHAPNAAGLFENGIVRETPSEDMLLTMSDPPNLVGATWSTGTANMMGLLAQGLVDLGFIGGAEVDRFGNLNTSYVGDWRAPTVKLPGSGGAPDIASYANRVVIVMPQERHRFVERVSYVTSAGYGEGGDWRRRNGLPGGGPVALITTLAVFRFDPTTGEAVLASYHPGQSVDTVRAQTGWELRVAPDVTETPTPSADELAIVRECDPRGFWIGTSGGSGRPSSPPAGDTAATLPPIARSHLDEKDAR
jgi:glutaconate CoA-transferase subunit B